MGYALAEELHNQDVELIIVSGPVSIETTIPPGNIINVTSGLEMYEACKQNFSQVDTAIFTAVVSDYRPKTKAILKINKHEEVAVVEFVKNPDIAFEFGKVKAPGQLSIGFVLKTDDVMVNAQKKLHSKNFDMVVINSPNKGEDFGYDTNKISILNAQKELKQFPQKHKKEVVMDILSYGGKLFSFSK